MNFTSFFFDPVLRGPTLGAMALCVTAALLGVLVFIRKKTLIGEMVSHSTYPGVTWAIAAFSTLLGEEGLGLGIFIGPL